MKRHRCCVNPKREARLTWSGRLFRFLFPGTLIRMRWKARRDYRRQVKEWAGKSLRAMLPAGTKWE